MIQDSLIVDILCSESTALVGAFRTALTARVAVVRLTQNKISLLVNRYVGCSVLWSRFASLVSYSHTVDSSAVDGTNWDVDR
jgi:hypothetical protein